MLGRRRFNVMKHRYKWDWNALHLLKPQFSPQSKLSEQGAIKRLFVRKRSRAANVRWESIYKFI
jgi:hypothetical protein